MSTAHVFRRLVEQQQRQALMATTPPTRAFPGKCRCSHPESSHGTDRKGRPTCFFGVCACTRFREDGVTEAMRRHPSGKAIPARFDERYDPSPEPIDRRTR